LTINSRIDYSSYINKNKGDKTMATTTFSALTKQMTKFNSLESARTFCDNAVKINMILMGDDGKYWVGLPRYTNQLHAQGYEYIK
jgi:hypothetical protein